jgi:hypothetical protein
MPDQTVFERASRIPRKARSDVVFGASWTCVVA